MSAIRPVAAALPGRPVRPAAPARAAAPAAAPAPRKVVARAEVPAAPIGPKPAPPAKIGLGSAKAVEAYVKALVTYILANQAQLEGPFQALQAARAEAQDKALSFLPPLTAAHQAYDAVHNQYIGPVNAAKSELRSAEYQLYRAERPGLAEAERLEREVDDLEDDIDAAKRAISDRESRIRRAKSEISSNRSSISWERAKEDPDEAAISRMEREIAELEDDIDDYDREIDGYERKIRSLEDDIDDLEDDIRYQMSRRNPPDHPLVVAAQARLDAARKQLADAQAAYNAAIAGPTRHRDEQQKIYDDKMAAFNQKVATLQQTVDQFQKPRDEAYADFQQLKKNVGWFKRTWWKLFGGVDFRKLMAEEAQKIQPGVTLGASTKGAA